MEGPPHTDASADELHELALTHARCGDPFGCLSTALEGALRAHQQSDAITEARFLALAGNAYMELGETADALSMLERAIALMEGIDDPAFEAHVLHMAGWTMKEVGRAAAGRELALRAIELTAGERFLRIRADALVSLGDIECSIAAAMPRSPERNAVLDRAQEALEEAVRLARATGSTNFEGRALGNMGEALALRGEHRAAIAIQEQALEIMLSGRDLGAASEGYWRLARSERALGRIEAARTHLTRTLELAADQGAKFDEARAHQELALIAESERDFESAYRHLIHVRTVERELASDRAIRSAELMSLRIAAEESGREAAQLREQSRMLTELSDQLRLEREAFARQALVDPLTGLANRRALEQTIVALAGDAPEALHTVAVADIDRFKEINDRFGHGAGDEVLRVVGKVLERFARREDLVCRYGGEEFVLLLASGDPRLARSMPERIRAAIEAHPWSQIHAELTVTISIGVASGLAADIEAVLRTADALLYRAKGAGRNHVEHAEAA